MIWVIYLILSIVSVILAFYSILYSWILLFIVNIYIFFVYLVVKKKKFNSHESFTPEEAVLFQKHTHYFTYHQSAKTYGGICIFMPIAGIVMSIINTFHSFYLGILFGIINWFLMNLLSNYFNPFNHVFNEKEKEISKKVLRKIFELGKTDKQR